MSNDLDNLERRLSMSNASGNSITSQQDPLVVRRNPPFSLRVRELLAACDKNPDHELVPIFRKAVKGMPPEQQVVVDRADIEAVLRNGIVVTTETFEQDPDDPNMTVRVLQKSVKERTVTLNRKSPQTESASGTTSPKEK